MSSSSGRPLEEAADRVVSRRIPDKEKRVARAPASEPVRARVMTSRRVRENHRNAHGPRVASPSRDAPVRQRHHVGHASLGNARPGNVVKGRVMNPFAPIRKLAPLCVPHIERARPVRARERLPPAADEASPLVALCRLLEVRARAGNGTGTRDSAGWAMLSQWKCSVKKWRQFCPERAVRDSFFTENARAAPSRVVVARNAAR